MQNPTSNDSGEARDRAPSEQRADHPAASGNQLSRALLDSIAWDSRQRARRKRLGLK